MLSSSRGVSVRVLVGLVVGAFVLGLATKTLLFRDPASPGRAIDRAKVQEPGSGSVNRPSDAATIRTREGAQAAAIGFVELGDRLLSLDETAAADVLARVASRESREQFVRTQLANFEQLRTALGRGAGPIRFRVGVIAIRVDAFDGRRVRVALWRVGVLSRDGMTSVGAQWAIVTYDLVWEDGGWKIWGETTSPGPTPAETTTRAATPAELDATLQGFVPVGAR